MPAQGIVLHSVLSNLDLHLKHMNKRQHSFIFFFTILVTIGGIVASVSSPKMARAFVPVIDYVYGDHPDPSIYVKDSSDIFVGKVITASNPHDVRVLHVLKGNARGVVKVYADYDQLRIGATYIFPASYHADEKQYSLNDTIPDRQPIITDASLSDLQLRTLAANNDRVKGFESLIHPLPQTITILDKLDSVFSPIKAAFMPKGSLYIVVHNVSHALSDTLIRLVAALIALICFLICLIVRRRLFLSSRRRRAYISGANSV
jgi:hypothetical protein